MSKHLFEKLVAMKGCQFIGIQGYVSKTTGEIANHTINVGLSVNKAKETDLALLQSTDVETVSKNVSVNKGIALEICNTALNELRTSALRNVSKDMNERTTQSKAQTNAYLTHPDFPAIRIHKDTFEVHIFGMSVQKKVIKKGEYKVVKSQPKTIAKKGITKELNLRAGKFRTFVVGHINKIAIQGETYEFEGRKIPSIPLL